jgi:DNA polymerase-3 subunit epsilon
MRNVLILDTETTGLSASPNGLTGSKGVLAQVAAILYNVENRASISQFSTLLPVEINPQIGVNRIKPNVSQEVSESLLKTGLSVLDVMALHADAIVAHNAGFDRQWINGQILPAMPWICSYKDINWQPIKNTDLVRLAVAHDVPIINAHDGLGDCQLLASIFSKRNDLEELLADALRPKYRVKAMVTKEQKELAKDHGFKAVYNNGVFSHWEKLINEKDLNEFPFDCQVVG